MAKTDFKFNKEKHLIPALVVLLVGAAFYIGQLSSENKYLKGGGTTALPTSGEPFLPEDRSALATNVERPSGDDHVRGNPNANIAIIEYSDYECPFCGQFHPTMQQAISEFGDEIMWVYRHWPLDFHPMAMPSAVASECVAELAGEGAFWSFTDAIFAEQELLSLAQIDAWALEQGVNNAQYETCKSDPATTAKVSADLTSGNDAGVQGTPGVIVLNIESGEVQVLPGAVPYAQVKAAVESLR